MVKVARPQVIILKKYVDYKTRAKRKKAKRIAFASLCILIILACLYPKVKNTVESFTSQSNDSERIEVDFVRHIDGDTSVFLLNGEETTVRYLAIDTEETVHPTQEATELGQTASDYVEEKLENAKIIELEFDENSDLEDYYGRTLAWVWVDDELLQLELVTLGLATVEYIYGDYKYLDLLYQAESKF